ncbi:leucine-rich repeat domain-containing protein, partial [Prevotella dentalis]|uniref:leucine-rich repeat domain-containing protein n=1 Tax=Prevotella dentalis TaxID=52227 RepID=UPI00265977B9
DFLDLGKSKVLAALQSLLADEELKTLLSMFLMASAKKNLSMCSFRLFGLKVPHCEQPKEEEVLSTKVTEEDIKNGIEDEFGVAYSKDGERLLKATRYLSGRYMIKEGTKVICNEAFDMRESLTSINIPDSVTSIGDSAFCWCKSLTCINIPESVIKMEGNPFAGWKGSLSIESKSFIYENNVLFNADKTIIIAYRADNELYNIPGYVTNIGDWAFAGYKSLTSINIPDSVTSIGDSAFRGCESLTNINIPDSVTSIGDSAFYKCESLSSINIPDSVTSIGNSAFRRCKSLTSINIPDSVTSIGDWAFAECKSLTSINIPDSVTSIGNSAFGGCESLTNINIPDSVTSIGNMAFYGCESLTSINIPDSVTSIGNMAFYGCESLPSINIPDSVIKMEGNPFASWHGSLNIESKSFIYENDVLFNADKTTIIAYRADDELYNIPDSVTSIENSAFRGCESLASINIPDSVTSIGKLAFNGCNNLNPQIKDDIIERFGEIVYYLW